MRALLACAATAANDVSGERAPSSVETSRRCGPGRLPPTNIAPKHNEGPQLIALPQDVGLHLCVCVRDRSGGGGGGGRLSLLVFWPHDLICRQSIHDPWPSNSKTGLSTRPKMMRMMAATMTCFLSGRAPWNEWGPAERSKKSAREISLTLRFSASSLRSGRSAMLLAMSNWCTSEASRTKRNETKQAVSCDLQAGELAISPLGNFGRGRPDGMVQRGFPRAVLPLPKFAETR